MAIGLFLAVVGVERMTIPWYYSVREKRE